MIILAVAAAIIFLLLVLPIRIFVRCSGVRSEVWGKVGFFKFSIYPRPKKPASGEPAPDKTASSGIDKEAAQSPPFEAPKPQESETEAKTESKKNTPKEKPPEKSEKPSQAGENDNTPGTIERLTEYLKKAQEFLGPLRKALRMLIKAERVEATVTIGAEEADKTAIYAGMLWGLGYSVIALIDGLIKVENHSYNVIPSYDRPVIEAEAFCILRSNLANIIGAAAIIGIAFLKYKHKKNRRTKT